MDMSYKFISETEPTDEQLETLMREVAIDARKRKEEPDSAFWKSLKDEVMRTAGRSKMELESCLKRNEKKA